MQRRLVNATGFKRVFDLFAQGHAEEARELLTSLQDEFLALYEENETLRRQLDEVAAILDMAECMEFDGQKYWVRDGGKTDGPFCQLCYDRDGQLVRLQQREKHWHCHNCSSAFLVTKARKKRETVGVGRVSFKSAIPMFVK